MTQNPHSGVAVIVVAAGAGTRLGASLPKAFVDLAGRPILAHALDSIFRMEEPSQVIVVVPAAQLTAAREMLAQINDAAPGTVEHDVTLVAGGDTRQGSVAAGLSALETGTQVVLIHDAARALAPTALFERVIAAVRDRRCGIVPGLPVSDTIKAVDVRGTVLGTLDRSPLQAVQTPQGFLADELLTAYRAAGTAPGAPEFTDDAALFADAGHPVQVIDGDALAFKITTPWDLRRARQLLDEQATPCTGTGTGTGSSPSAISNPSFTPPRGMRTGVGVDAHAFDDTAELWLAGLYWPDERGLAGHSDGDVVCHALSDALLSAAGLGDIGSVFGVSDPTYSNAHGDAFVNEAMRLVHAAGWAVENASVQVIGNRPRLAARRVEAETWLSDILRAPVSLSATTTDGLGFTGQGAGIAAIASVLLRTASEPVATPVTGRGANPATDPAA